MGDLNGRSQDGFRPDHLCDSATPPNHTYITDSGTLEWKQGLPQSKHLESVLYYHDGKVCRRIVLRSQVELRMEFRLMKCRTN